MPPPRPAPAIAPSADGRPWRAEPVTPAALPSYDVPDKASFRMMVAVKQVGRLGDDVAIADDGRDVDASRLDYALNEWDETIGAKELDDDEVGLDYQRWVELKLRLMDFLENKNEFDPPA